MKEFKKKINMREEEPWEYYAYTTRDSGFPK